MRSPFDREERPSFSEDYPSDDPWEPFGLLDPHDPWLQWRPRHCDTSRRVDQGGVPLADVHVPSIREPEAPRPEPSSHTVSVVLMTSDGVPCSSVALTVRSASSEGKAKTDDDGLVSLAVPSEDEYEITLDDTPLRLPPPNDEPPRAMPVYLRRIARDTESFRVPSDDRKLLVVVRPSVTEILLDGYAEGASVMRWGGTRVRKDGSVGTARAALRTALWLGRGKTMAVIGHTDPLGQDADNDALSAARAESVQLFAAGDLDGWSEHAAAHANELDLACALVATNRSLGRAPFGVDDEHARDDALDVLRLHAGLPSHGPATSADWRAIADLYDLDLAALLVTDRAGLAEIRSTIAWTSPAWLALGERQPRPEVELAETLAGPAALAHRRCSLCVFGPTDTPQAAIDREGVEIYDGTYLRTVVDPPGEALVQIAVDTPRRSPIAAGRAWVCVGQLGAVPMIADADGVIRFPALKGERIEIVAAFDANGHGTIVSAGDDRSAPSPAA